MAETVPSHRAEKLDEILAAAAEPALRPDIADADSRAATVRPRPTSRRITPAEISVSRGARGCRARLLGPRHVHGPRSRGGGAGPAASPGGGGTRGVAAPRVLPSPPRPLGGPPPPPPEAPALLAPRGVSTPAHCSHLAPWAASRAPATPGPLPTLAPPTSAPPHWLRPCSAQEWTGGAGRRGCALEPPCPLPDPQSLFERQGLPGPEKLPGSLRKGIPRTKSVGTRGGARRGEAGQGGCTLA